MNRTIRIGITASESRFENYPAWIKGNDPAIEVVELHWDKHSIDEVWDEVEDCDGIVLTGGVDTHPDFYENARLDYPNKPAAWNRERDEFEMHVFETALNFKLPVLAICRGLQLVNVALGGTLVQDLQEAGREDHRRQGDIDRTHNVQVTEGTLLHHITGTLQGTINSAHHQAIGTVSDELVANATSPDGVIEGAEWKSKDGNNWLLCVQWHPERMANKEGSPFSANIRQQFLAEAARTTHG